MKVLACGGLLLLAWWLRVQSLNGPRFHPDEALFASYARAIAVWRDPLLQGVLVDKPPLLFYLQALCYPFLGPKEMAARLPSLVASTLTVALCLALTKHLCRRVRECVTEEGADPPRETMGSLIAGVIVVLSPMAVAFSPTAFTDPLAVMWGTAAVLAAASKRYGKAGLFLGLGMATKYQAGLFSLLVVPLLASDPDRGRRVTSCGGAGAWARCAAGVLVPLSLVAGWDWARSGRLSLLETQWLSYGGLRFAYSEDLWPRLVDWLRLGRWVVGAKSVGLIVVALGIAWIASVAAGGRRRGSDGVGILLVFWLAAYGALHWLLEVPVWDRYLLPAVPVLAALAGWLVARLLGTGTVTWILVGVFLISMLPSSLASAQGKLPLGGDHGTFDGMEQVASFFADQPYGTVLYDHWLSWELYYYLFDSRVYISWFADPEALIRDLTAFGANSPRYLVIPAWEDAEPILRALDVAGFSALSALQAHRSDDSVAFLVWRIAGGT